MAMPDVMIDPQDPALKGRTWDAVEKALDERERFLCATAGGCLAAEDRGPSSRQPCRPVYAAFPWEEKVEPFERAAKCTLDSWSHGCVGVSFGPGTVTLRLGAGGAAASGNTFGPELLDALQDAVMDLETRVGVRAVILRAEGKMFSKGFDPKFIMSKEAELGPEGTSAVQRQLARVLNAWYRLPQFTIALVQGSVMGAAVGVVCACDAVYAVKGAFYSVNEGKLGSVASVSIPYIVRRATHFKDAYQLVLAARNISADAAFEQGLVDAVVEDMEALDAECRAACGKLTLCAPGAVAASKDVISGTLSAPASTFTMEHVASVAGEVRNGPEFKAALEAIAARRAPAWAAQPVQAAAAAA